MDDARSTAGGAERLLHPRREAGHAPWRGRIAGCALLPLGCLASVVLFALLLLMVFVVMAECTWRTSPEKRFRNETNEVITVYVLWAGPELDLHGDFMNVSAEDLPPPANERRYPHTYRADLEPGQSSSLSGKLEWGIPSGAAALLSSIRIYRADGDLLSTQAFANPTSEVVISLGE